MDKNKIQLTLPRRDSLQLKRHAETKSKEMEKNIPCKWKPKWSGIATFISDK